ncbi:MAG: hypothetical protein CL674_01055 [Bdellovibrionaceae bacterium]|nr:hypothetical protein [Pseudobdellovibrionaceae bacterium]|tara:strand:+ start:17311 stop:17604 length:294 start_codon:yes stop_codon:yes gene_type:complete
MKIRVDLNEGNKELFENLEKAMNERGVKTIDKSHVVNAALDKMKQSFWTQMEEDFTPLDWKIKVALGDAKGRKDIEKIVNSIISGKTKESVNVQSHK